jgi:hypothetical protein
VIRPGVEIKGAKEIEDALKFYMQDVQVSLKSAVQATALEALTRVRRSMRDTPKTGKEYPRRKGGTKIHIASKAPNPPAIDTGTLTGSIYYMMVDDLTASIGSRLDYAYYLEFGTFKMGGPSGARKAWLPAAEWAGPILQKRIERILRKAKARAEKTTK